MKLIPSRMGRRQFLTGALATSTLSLAGKKVAGAFTSGSKPGMMAASLLPTGIAMASESRSGAPVDISRDVRFPHLLSPLKIGNVVLKNRMYSTNAVPHYLQGPESFPADPSRTYAARLAKNGAAIITCRIIQNRERKDLHGDSAHMLIYDMEDTGVQNYLNQLVEGIHCYGAKASVPILIAEPGRQAGMPPGASMLGGVPGAGMAGDGPGAQEPGMMPMSAAPKTEITVETLQKIIEETVTQLKFFQDQGFDMACLANSLTANLKTRTDEYGGSLKNRARFPMELCQAVKKACGQDFLIECPIAIIEPSIRPEETDSAYTLEEAVELAKMWEGMVDILQLRVAGGKANHPTGWNSEKNKPLTLRFAEALKKSGTKIAIAPNGGFQDLAFNNACIEAGKTDLIAIGRYFICDWEYGKKAYEGRGEDVVPCIMCNKCHGTSTTSEWYSVCSVNPKMGISSALKLIHPPDAPRTVAVIGGGPAGMKAALVASERGHSVTLYEKSGSLGGNLKHADYSPYKWPLKDYKDYLVRHVNKAGIKVVLGTEATPDMIRANGFDVVMAAVGAEPVIPRIAGVEDANVWNVVDVYGKEKELGKTVVLVGGGEFGTETGIYLANAGHKVTVLTSEKQLMRMNRVHYPEQIIDTYEHLDNFSYITEAVPVAISRGTVTYTDSKGGRKSLPADSVVIYAGLKPRKEAALRFYGSAKRFFSVGDCGDEGGNVQKSTRDAFFCASQV